MSKNRVSSNHYSVLLQRPNLPPLRTVIRTSIPRTMRYATCREIAKKKKKQMPTEKRNVFFIGSLDALRIGIVQKSLAWHRLYLCGGSTLL